MATGNGLPPLRGRACDCGVCGLRFTGVDAFDAHRVTGGDKLRRCLTTDEMRTAGLEPTSRGWRRAGRVRVAA
jgi:hypothetical protein